jgi:DNA-binding HxlR family transcriptional regulator
MSDDCCTPAEPDDDWQRTWHAVREVLGSKWAFHVVRALAESEVGFNDLKRELEGVTSKTLSERLQELRCLGFVEKEVHATSPPTTTYRLTDPGSELAGVLADVESLVEIVECPEQDCPMPPATAPDCVSDRASDCVSDRASDCACET